MEAKNNTSNSEILDGTIEYLEQNYKTVDTLPAESSKPELETVVNGIIASNSTVRKNLDPVPPIFAKYNGHWYKWCPNCRQDHRILQQTPWIYSPRRLSQRLCPDSPCIHHDQQR